MGWTYNRPYPTKKKDNLSDYWMRDLDSITARQAQQGKYITITKDVKNRMKNPIFLS